jgi:uncharacterized protein
MPPERLVATPQGDARLVVRRAKRPLATLVLTHGAGGGIDAPDLVRLARTLPQHDISVTLVEMPWRLQGKKLAPRPEVIDETYRAVMDSMRMRSPLVIGGRSAGARSACRIARSVGAKGVLALSFPLHPPGRPEKSRLAELDLPAAAGLPTLVLQGTRDAFGGPTDIPPAPGRLVMPVEGADHSLRVAKAAGGSPLAQVVEVTLLWARQVAAG